MKYFSPNYWFKLWLLSAPLFNDETKGINAMSINNKKIKDWASNNTNLDLINQNINQESITNQPYSLLNQSNQNYLDLQNYENNLNLIENRLEYEEKSKRIKKQVTPNPQNWEINLNVPSVRQIDPDWCGPAIGESLLRHIGINPQEIINNYNRDNFGIQGLPDRTATSVQQVLANLMYTIPPFPQLLGDGRGTTPHNWQNGIIIVLRRFNRQNQINLENFIPPRYALPINQIPRSFLNNPGHNDEWDHQWETITSEVELQRRRDLQQRGYRQNHEQRQELEAIRNRIRFEESNNPIHPIHYEANFRNYFFQYLNSVVRNSLRNNIPVAFAQSFQPGHRAYAGHGRHFVLIDSIGPETNDLGEVRYRFMDPGDGSYQIYTGHELYYRGGDDFYLIGSFNQVLELQDEQMEIDYGRSILTGFMFIQFLNCNRQKRSLDLFNKNLNKQFCDLKPQIDQIHGKITSVKIVDESFTGIAPLLINDIFIGTTERIYLIRNKLVSKFQGFSFPIKDIILSKKHNNVLILSEKGEIYCWDGPTFVKKNTNYENNQGKIIAFEILEKSSEDKYLNDGDILFWTDKNNIYLINCDNWKIEKMTNNYNNIYFIHHNNEDIIEKVHYNPTDSTYCHSKGKKVTAIAGSTAAGAIAGSVIPVIGTLIGGAIGGLIGFGGSVIMTEELCNKRKREINTSEIKEKNITQWNDNLTKSINNEQNLPIINNTNFVKSNITSL